MIFEKNEKIKNKQNIFWKIFFWHFFWKFCFFVFLLLIIVLFWPSAVAKLVAYFFIHKKWYSIKSMFFGLCRDESRGDQYDKVWNSRIPQGKMIFWCRSSCKKLMYWNRCHTRKDRTHEKTFRSLKKGSGLH